MSVVIYFVVARNLADQINHYLIFLSTLTSLLISARFFSMNQKGSFAISLSGYLLGIGFLYYVINYVPYTLLKIRGLGFPVYFTLSILGVFVGYWLRRKAGSSTS